MQDFLAIFDLTDVWSDKGEFFCLFKGESIHHLHFDNHCDSPVTYLCRSRTSQNHWCLSQTVGSHTGPINHSTFLPNCNRTCVTFHNGMPFFCFEMVTKEWQFLLKNDRSATHVPVVKWSLNYPVADNWRFHTNTRSGDQWKPKTIWDVHWPVTNEETDSNIQICHFRSLVERKHLFRHLTKEICFVYQDNLTNNTWMSSMADADHQLRSRTCSSWLVCVCVCLRERAIKRSVFVNTLKSGFCKCTRKSCRRIRTSFTLDMSLNSFSSSIPSVFLTAQNNNINVELQAQNTASFSAAKKLAGLSFWAEMDLSCGLYIQKRPNKH